MITVIKSSGFYCSLKTAILSNTALLKVLSLSKGPNMFGYIFTLYKQHTVVVNDCVGVSIATMDISLLRKVITVDKFDFENTVKYVKNLILIWFLSRQCIFTIK